MASIHQKSDNKYKIIVSNGYDRNNKKIVKTKVVTLPENLTNKQKEKELQRLATLFEDEIKKGSYIEKSISFEKFATKWLEEYAEKRLERKTIYSYKMELDTKIFPAIGHVQLDKLQPLHLIKFYDQLTGDGIRLDGKSGGYSNRTIQYQHQIISSILQTAVFWQVIELNIAKRVKPPKGITAKDKDNFFDSDQAFRFLDFVQQQYELKYVALANVTMYGGLRTEEVLGLTWDNIDFVNNKISIKKALSYVDGEAFMKVTKNNSSVRTISLPKNVMTMLKEFKLQSKDERVFDFNYYTPNHWIKKAILKYNDIYPDKKIPEITFHGLRHTSATLLISTGMDIKTVSGRLGHNDTSTTLNIYSHYLKNKDEEASDALEDMLKPPKSK